MKLNVRFNDRQAAALESLAAETGTTRAGVLKAALALLGVALREQRAGGTLAVVRGDKVVKEIVGVGHAAGLSRKGAG